MSESELDERWHVKMLQPRLPWGARALLPADVGNELCTVMLNRENLLEDVHYQKVAPNRFIVEVSAENYTRSFHPLESRILQQWQIKLLEHLSTANSRLGRKEYVLSGKVEIQIRPSNELKDTQTRIYSQIQPDQFEPSVQKPKRGREMNKPLGTVPPAQPLVQPLQACLEMLPGRQRQPIYPGMMTLGRQDTCDIFLNQPEVQERRLISGQHAYLHSSAEQVILFDGAPNGRPSLNGTYVNQQRVGSTGVVLKDGDIITLAALNPTDVRTDTPGVVSFRFRADCRN